MPPFRKHELDMLESDTDPGLTRLVRDLDAVYAISAPPRLRGAFARLLHEHADANQPVGRDEGPAPRVMRRSRHALVAAALVAVAALVAGSVLAAQSPLNRLFAVFFNNGDTPAPVHGAAPDETPPLGADVVIPQTVCGYTITIRRLYADVNRVVVGYTFSPPPERHYSEAESDWPILTDTNAPGATLRGMSGFGSPPQDGVSTDVWEFDASTVATTTAPLALRMTIPTLTTNSATLPSNLKPCEQVGRRVPDPNAAGGRSYPITIKGPFTFDFTVPVTTSARTAQINQTLTSSHGTSVTLERVVVTPSEARVYLQGPPQNEIAEGESIAPTLYVGGKEIDSGIGMPLGGSRRDDSFGNWGINLYQYHGEWTLKVLTDPIVRNYSRSWSDSVTFHCTVP